MKFFITILALAGLAIAAPAPQRPGQAVTSSAAASAAPSQACYNRGCGGNYPWKKDEIVERAPEPVVAAIVERAPEPVVVEVVEARAQRPGAPVASSSSAAASEPTQACYNRGCGGNYPW